MSALALPDDHALVSPGDADRAVANDRRVVTTADRLGHGRVRAVSATVLPAGIPLRLVPIRLCAARPSHKTGSNL